MEPPDDQLRDTTKINIGLEKNEPILHPAHISITETQTSEHIESEASVRTIKLSAKIDEFLFKLGYSSVHTVGILLQLMIDGKIRIDFKNYTERLEVVNKSQLLSRKDALEMFEHYISEHPDFKQEVAETRSRESIQSMVTQKIIVQLPSHLQHANRNK